MEGSKNLAFVVRTVNHWFGAKLMTDTGIVLNDQMDEFSIPNTDSSNGLPPIYANMVFPGKRPLSSTCPTIGLSVGPTVALKV